MARYEALAVVQGKQNNKLGFLPCRQEYCLVGRPFFSKKKKRSQNQDIPNCMQFCENQSCIPNFCDERDVSGSGRSRAENGLYLYVTDHEIYINDVISITYIY